MYRTHTCGELTKKQVGKDVALSGWVHKRRDLGGLIFVDLRDRYGITQVVFHPDTVENFTIAESLKYEYVIRVTGSVEKRDAKTVNKDLATGEIELSATTVEVLSTAKPMPFEIFDAHKGEEDEELRMQYRYLDLRRKRMQENIALRHKMVATIRQFFYGEDFLEIETPTLVKGTPEGSREYLVPSRLDKGQFYVLPQSPQQLKQLLMVGGFDKYFQVARCYRDEDLRGDRQPEFTQFEIEMSFAEQEDVMALVEDCFHELTKKCAAQKEWKSYLKNDRFIRFTYDEAMRRYGSDKPDIRFGLSFVDVTEAAKNSGFGVFESAPHVFSLSLSKKIGECSRKDIDALTELAKKHGAGGLAWLRVGEDSGAVAKHTNDNFIKTLVKKTGAKDGDLLFFGAGEFLDALEPLGQVRLALGDMFSLRNPQHFAYCWITDFPLFEQKEDGTVQAAHHPFTMPNHEDLSLLNKKDMMKVRAYAYDVVLNGVELGGGSIRIHDAALQHKVFSLLGLSDADIERLFGHMLKAFAYGTPPHGGCAMGLDRTAMLFADEPNIREVIAFPKNQSARDLMLGAPSAFPDAQLKELGLKIVKK